ncbi:hypothetical protein F4778DRAFT_688308 [Xylariomycetidae sp. FL2044]|nr:hypothetical protein F4778DRAFT_688308 [Xylariomycetidae sp. FL2044]
MDELDGIYRDDFDVSQGFKDMGPNHTYSTISIAASPATDPKFSQVPVSQDGLVSFFKHHLDGQNNQPPSASLQLVTIIGQRDRPFIIFQVKKDVFMEIVHSIHLEPTVLSMIHYQYDGFHHFPRHGRDVYYLGTTRFALVWVFDHQTLTTSAIQVIRILSIPGEGDFTKLVDDLLERHRGLIHAPMLLGYVTALALCNRYDHEIMVDESHFYRRIWNDTGYGMDYRVENINPRNFKHRVKVEDLALLVQRINGVLNHISRKQRNLRMVATILNFTKTQSAMQGIMSPEGQTMVAQSTMKLEAAAVPLQCRVDASQDYLRFLQGGSERLAQLLFALMTHEDASVNTELAASSRKIAEAAKRDSSSMKTVAIMTMAFLPGTFIAALFAVPSLDWDSDNTVVTRYFWVYWAFTLPATALVFLLWLLLDNRTFLLGKLRGKTTNEKLE